MKITPTEISLHPTWDDLGRARFTVGAVYCVLYVDGNTWEAFCTWPGASLDPQRSVGTADNEEQARARATQALEAILGELHPRLLESVLRCGKDSEMKTCRFVWNLLVVVVVCAAAWALGPLIGWVRGA